MTPRSKTILPFGLAVSFFIGLFAMVENGHCATAPIVNNLQSISEGISTPVRMATDPLGNIYLSDPRGGGVLKFSSAGKLLQTMRSIKNVSGIAIAPNGDLLVSQGTSVAVLDKTSGSISLQFGAFGKANGIVVDPAGTIYVTDSLDNCVQVFNAAYAPVSTGNSAAGKPANSFGSVGRNAGQFMQPTGISYDKTTNQLAVTDTLNGRIQFFSTSGVYQKSLGSFGAGPLKFTSPQGIAFEYSSDDKSVSRIYVVDSFQSTIQVIDAATGSFLRYIGAYGLTSGKLAVPGDILYDRFDSLNNRLIVANGTGVLSMYGIDTNSAGTPSSGPALSINSLPLATNLTSLTITGSAASGAIVTVNGAAAAISGTNWSSTVNLSAGYNVITIAAADATGTTVKTVGINVIASSGGSTPVALTIAPRPAFSTSSLITLSGTVTEGATVSVNGIAATVGGTAWSLPFTLGQGLNNINIVAVKAGLSDSTASVNVTLDNTLPVLSTVLPQSGTTCSKPVQNITGTVIDSNASSVNVTVNGASLSVPVNDGTFSLAIVLTRGSNAIRLIAVDNAGNQSTAMSTSVTYNPMAPTITLTTPNGAVSGSPNFTLSGTAPTGSIVTVNNDAPLTLNNTRWSSVVSLAPGMNHFDINASDPITGTSSSLVAAITYSQGMPALSITTPPQDLAIAKQTYVIAGTASPGSAFSATLNGNALPVTVTSSGFTITLPPFTTPGNYAVTVNATDSLGATSTTTRTLVYDPTVPSMSLISTTPPKVTSTSGTLIAKDKNGAVGNVIVSGSTSSLDLTGVSYDPATLNIYTTTAAGTSTRNGDINLDGKLDIADALNTLQTSLGVVAQPTFEQLLRCDVGPMVNYEPMPDGKVRLDDVIVILNKFVGMGN